MPELMKFPRVAAFHWIFPLGPLTFWWSVNSAQRPRNSQCSHENMNEPARVFQSSFLGEGVVSDLPGVWKCEIMSELYSLVDGSKNTDQSRLLKNRKSLTWHYWHHSALTGISDVPVKTICQFGVMGGREFGYVSSRYLWYLALCCWRPFLEPLVLPQMSQLYETPSMWTWEDSTLKAIWGKL